MAYKGTIEKLISTSGKQEQMSTKPHHQTRVSLIEENHKIIYTALSTERAKTYLQAKVHVVTLVARKPDESVRSVSLERQFEALVHVASQVVVRQLVQHVQHPLRAVTLVPAVPVRRLCRSRGCGSGCRSCRTSVDDDVDWVRCLQHEVQQVHITRQTVPTYHRLQREPNQSHLHNSYFKCLKPQHTVNSLGLIKDFF